MLYMQTWTWYIYRQMRHLQLIEGSLSNVTDVVCVDSNLSHFHKIEIRKRI